MIIETVMNTDEQQKQVDEKARETQLLLDMLLMMVLVGGKEREEKEMAKLFADASFSQYNNHSHLWLQISHSALSMIILYI